MLHHESTARQRASDASDWLAAFERANGRRLRVLHIGNIANNAYNNAKIQRDRGIAADVLCHDYYHIMACPEWEDANFDGPLGDDMFPDWWAADLKGFKRPHWFAQGPLDACVRYLLASTVSAPSRQRLWRLLDLERWLICCKSWKTKLVHFAIFALTGRKVTYVYQPANGLLFREVAGAFTGLARCHPRASMRAKFTHLARRFDRFAHAAILAAHLPRYRNRMKRRLAELVAATNKSFRPRHDDHAEPPRLEDFEERSKYWWHPYIGLLFRRYDIIQAYGTYTIMPFIAGARTYVAYEHGTIREIPFQRTAEGRMCASTYRAATAVFVTNSDNLESAHRLGLAEDRITCLPHAFDSEKLERFAHENSKLSPLLDAPFQFFSPARQHWVDNDPGWAKGNDRVIHALRKVLDLGFDCRLRLVAWGNDLEATRSLIKSLDLDHAIEWVATMKKRELWREYLIADAVLDQFVVPAMGGVTFEAMMLGRRVISAIDESQTRRFFGEPPPIHNCRSADEIVAAMADICGDRADTAKRGLANQNWMRRYHSAQRIVELQLEVYRRILTGRRAQSNAAEEHRVAATA